MKSVALLALFLSSTIEKGHPFLLGSQPGQSALHHEAQTCFYSPYSSSVWPLVRRSSNTNSKSGKLWASNDSENDEKEEAARVRKQLEFLLGEPSSLGAPTTSVDVDALMDPANEDRIEELLPKQPPLTAAERDRRLAEIELLKELGDSDDALEKLWDLWFSERGATARQRLEQADRFLAGGQVLAAEKMLKQMIQEYGVYWVEPINRLATLLYMDGRLEESYQLCLVILHLRPYHFGALSGIVAVSIGLNKREQARRWAEKRLPSRVASSSFPPFSENGPSNPRRIEWVRNAVKEAQEALSRLDYQTKKDLGRPEDYYKNKKSPQKKETGPTGEPQSQLFDDDEDAWQ